MFYSTEAKSPGHKGYPGLEKGDFRFLPNCLQTHVNALVVIRHHLDRSCSLARLSILEARHHNLCLAFRQPGQMNGPIIAGALDFPDLFPALDGHISPEVSSHFLPFFVKYCDMNLSGVSLGHELRGRQGGLAGCQVEKNKLTPKELVQGNEMLVVIQEDGIADTNVQTQYGDRKGTRVNCLERCKDFHTVIVAMPHI